MVFVLTARFPEETHSVASDLFTLDLFPPN